MRLIKTISGKVTIANRLLLGKTKPALESNANIGLDNIVSRWHEIKVAEGSSESNVYKSYFLELIQNKSVLASFYQLIQPDIVLPQKISGRDFTGRANKIIEEIQEGFFKLDTSLIEIVLKEKSCSMLEREKAYNLLSNYKHCRLEGDIFEIHLTKHLELTNLDRDIILNQVKASHESINLATGKCVSVSGLKIIMPAPSAKADSIQAVGQGAVPPAGIWGKIRQALIDHHDSYGMAGEAIDRFWFSKLEPEVDEQKKAIKLKAPMSFIKDWISQRYAQILERCARGYQYSHKIFRRNI